MIKKVFLVIIEVLSIMLLGVWGCMIFVGGIVLIGTSTIFETFVSIIIATLMFSSLYFISKKVIKEFNNGDNNDKKN